MSFLRLAIPLALGLGALFYGLTSKKEEEPKDTGVPAPKSGISKENYEALVDAIEKLFTMQLSQGEALTQEGLSELTKLPEKYQKEVAKPYAEKAEKAASAIQKEITGAISQLAPFMKMGEETWRAGMAALPLDTLAPLLGKISELTALASETSPSDTLGKLLQRKYAQRALRTLSPIVQTALNYPLQTMEKAAVPWQTMAQLGSVLGGQTRLMKEAEEMKLAPYSTTAQVMSRLFSAIPTSKINVGTRALESGTSLLGSLGRIATQEEAQKLKALSNLATLSPEAIPYLKELLGME